MAGSSFRELRVWQDAMKLTEEVYRQTGGFPRHEVYGLTQQMRRAAVSIPSNIAEGKGRQTDREFSQFLFHARGSLLELETQFMIAQALQYLSVAESQRILNMAEGVGRALAGLINSLRQSADFPKDKRPMANDHHV
jgi:four helix bundle protein